MKESEYIKATNRVKISAALTLLRDVLTGEDYGISKDDLAKATAPLCEAEEKLFSMIEIQDDS